MGTYGLQGLAHTTHKQSRPSLPTVHEEKDFTGTEQSCWLRLLTCLRAIRTHLLPSLQKRLPHTAPSFTLSNPSPFLLDQLHQDSNYEMEWLWAASQVTTPEEIRYCLERALYINPANHDAQHSLCMLLTR